MIKEYEAGASASQLCRRHGISAAMLCKHRAKNDVMNGSGAMKLRVMEDENGRLKRLLADGIQDNPVGRSSDIFSSSHC